MTTNTNNKQPTQSIQINDPFSSMISVLIFSCVCTFIVIGIVSTIFRYSMAAIALNKGDVGAAATIMSPNAYQYHRYNQPAMISLKL